MSTLTLSPHQLAAISRRRKTGRPFAVAVLGLAVLAAAEHMTMLVKRTLRHVHLMSAIPPKVEMSWAHWHVRFVPEADICLSATIRIVA
jgi:hypothetical protein